MRCSANTYRGSIGKRQTKEEARSTSPTMMDNALPLRPRRTTRTVSGGRRSVVGGRRSEEPEGACIQFQLAQRVGGGSLTRQLIALG